MSEETFLFTKVATGETVEASSPSMIMWHVKTGNEIPVNKITGEVQYEDEMIAYPWEKFIELYRPASPEAKAFITKCLGVILEAYQAKIYRVQEYIASLS
jgi:hypothetical protein